MRKRLAEMFRIARAEGALRKSMDGYDDADEALSMIRKEVWGIKFWIFMIIMSIFAALGIVFIWLIILGMPWHWPMNLGIR